MRARCQCSARHAAPAGSQPRWVSTWQPRQGGVRRRSARAPQHEPPAQQAQHAGGMRTSGHQGMHPPAPAGGPPTHMVMAAFISRFSSSTASTRSVFHTKPRSDSLMSCGEGRGRKGGGGRGFQGLGGNSITVSAAGRVLPRTRARCSLPTALCPQTLATAAVPELPPTPTHLVRLRALVYQLAALLQALLRAEHRRVVLHDLLHVAPDGGGGQAAVGVSAGRARAAGRQGSARVGRCSRCSSVLHNTSRGAHAAAVTAGAPHPPEQ